MSLYEIDHGATQARLDASGASGLRALDECARRSAEIGKQVKAMRARQEREKQAIDEQVRNATRNKPEPPKQPPARPATLALGGEEFRETKAAQQPRPLMPPRPPAPGGPMPPAGPGGQGRPVPQAKPGGQSPARPVPQAVPGRPVVQPRPVAQTRSGIHIRRESQARPVHNRPPVVENKPAKPPANDEPPPPTRRTFTLGAPEDRESDDRKPPAADRKQPSGERKPPAEDRKSQPPKTRKPPAEGDDDLSGRTWLR